MSEAPGVMEDCMKASVKAVGHTPGVWSVFAGTIIHNKEGGWIANVPETTNGINGFDETRANARLIAVAPEMLTEIEQSILEAEEAASLLEMGKEPDILFVLGCPMSNLKEVASLYRKAADRKKALLAKATGGAA